MVRGEIGILVVDDVNAMRVQIKDLLQTFGYKNVYIAESGLAAMTVLKSQRIHLILCDWHMSPTDGLQMLIFMKSQPEFKDIAFMMVTAESTQERVIQAIKAGVDSYLTKPLTLEQVETKVKEILIKKKVLG